MYVKLGNKYVHRRGEVYVFPVTLLSFELHFEDLGN